MERKTYTIYDSYDVCSDENMKYAKEDLLERIFEGADKITITDEYGKEVEVTQEEYAKAKLTEEKIYDECYFQNNLWFDDERANLSSVEDSGELIAIADVGTWRGTFSGYKKIKDLPDVLYSSCDYERVYVDSNGDLRKEESHHDGSNSILYRYFKDELTDEQKDNFLDKIYNGECTQKDITRYTRKAGVGIAKMFGWKVRGVAC